MGCEILESTKLENPCEVMRVHGAARPSVHPHMGTMRLHGLLPTSYEHHVGPWSSHGLLC